MWSTIFVRPTTSSAISFSVKTVSILGVSSWDWTPKWQVSELHSKDITWASCWKLISSRQWSKKKSRPKSVKKFLKKLGFLFDFKPDLFLTLFIDPDCAMNRLRVVPVKCFCPLSSVEQLKPFRQMTSERLVKSWLLLRNMKGQRDVLLF